MLGKKISMFLLALSIMLMQAVVVSASETVAASDTAAVADARGFTICDGVFAGEVEISGMTEEEALAAINAYVSQITSAQIVLSMDSNQVAVPAQELGYYWSDTDIVKEAVSLGKSGNVIKRYKDVKDIQKESKVYEITYDVNRETLTNAINTYCGGFNVTHVNPDIVKEGSGFRVVGDAVQGRVIDVDSSVAQITDFLLNGWDQKDASAALVVVDDKASATVEDCARVKDLLGSYSTSFSTSSGNYNRNMNMKNGARLINGSVVYPGETFSANAKLDPFTAANGYYDAGTYENGRVVDSIGGGICQVSTTLYNSILLAELEVVQRSNHSMSVGYVPLAQDAALAGTWKDLKFKNNTRTPVYVEAIYTDGKVTFNLYGEETRAAGRTIKYVSETISTTPFSEKVTEDPSKPAGYRVTTSAGHTGYVAKLWKHVYMNGAEQSVDLVNTSTYQSSAALVTVGTGAAASTPPADVPSSETPAANTPTEPATQPTQQESSTGTNPAAGGQ